MHSLPARSFAVFGTAILFLAPSSFAFDSPLSDTAVREAYFLGQRRDEGMVRALDKYTKHFQAPKSGPQISSVTFFTPFALVVQSSYEHTMGYSAQQAEIDHRGQKETVKIVVEIALTDSYGAIIARPTAKDPDAPVGYTLRSYDFWEDFSVEFSGEDGGPLSPLVSSGHPEFVCNDGCTLTGATLEFEFPASAFASTDSATIQINPPEGEPITVVFDLDSFR